MLENAPFLAPDEDAYSKRDLVFPKLSQLQVGRSLSCDSVEQYTAGQTIYGRGTRGVEFLIVLRGQAYSLSVTCAREA